MISKTTLLGGVAAVVVVGGIAFAMSTAGAATYNNYDEPTYHHTVHHVTRHSTRSGRYENARYESDRAMANDQQMPASFQVGLSSIDRPNDQLKHASVRDAEGNTVGYVNGLITGPEGDIRAVKMKVGGLWGYGGKLVTVGAADFRWAGATATSIDVGYPEKEFDNMPAQKSCRTPHRGRSGLQDRGSPLPQGERAVSRHRINGNMRMRGMPRSYSPLPLWERVAGLRSINTR